MLDRKPCVFCLPAPIPGSLCQDTWQRTTLAFATVSGEERMVKAVLDEVDRFVWSFPEVEVVESRVRWMEDD